ncbi:MAG TPA: DUF420 domain-containing protein [Thermoanaerobaculia bacterium]|nr:DUF420 domain-containing protein [Thermoanaerobaculia bacterium]
MVDARLAYWTFALLDLALAVALALGGWRLARRGEIARHRRRMNVAVAAVLVFLLSYLLKVLFLGREDLASWSPAAILTLRIHETIVLVMLLAGGAARWLAARRDFVTAAAAGTPPRVWHRWLGRLAVVAAVLGLISAAVVLVQMYQRAWPRD